MKLLLLLSFMFFGDPVLFRPTGRYIERSVTNVKANGDVVTRTRTNSRQRGLRVAMFTAGYCGHCQTFKNRHKSRVVARGIPVDEFDMSDPSVSALYSKSISSLPTFVFYDPETSVWYNKHTITGSVSGDTIINRYDEIISQPVEVITPSVEVITPAPVTQPAPAPPVEYVYPPQTQSRYITWPGWGRIDLETYGHGCRCSMCRTIAGMQQTYRAQKQPMLRYQTAAPVVVPDDQQPCPPALVEQMLDLMKLNPTDVIADLGCGDGRILIAAAKRGIRGIGVELDHARAGVASKAIEAAGMSHMIEVIVGDARQFDTSSATAITAYLYPPLLEELAPKLSKARVVASPYHEIPGLEMDKSHHGDVWLYKSRVEIASVE